MKTQMLKEEVIKKISEIQNDELLESLSKLLEMPTSNLSSFLKMANSKIQENYSETEDFTGYIKEWVKSM
ncbi:MAG: hypothetical protein ACWA42_11410 [Lutibacter sp.]